MEPTSVILNQSSPMFNVPPYSCRTEMYSTKPLKSDDNNFEKMYANPVKPPPLSGNSPKRENFLQTVIGAVTNMIEESVLKVHETVLSNFSNPSLSVTLVQNTGIISPDFFKTLVKGEESFEENNTGRIQHTTPMKDNSFIDDNLISKCNDYWYYESANEDEDIEILQQFCQKDTKKDKSFIPNNNIEKSMDLETMRPKVTTPINNRDDDDENDKTANNTNNKSSELGLTDFMINTWQKLFKISSPTAATTRTTTTTPVEDEEMFQKRAYSMKQKQKTKSKVVANGRGRGRAKSQLRHSGVSQSRLKKERSRFNNHNLMFDIQNGLDVWEEFVEVENWSDENEDDVELIECPIGFTFADIRPRGLSKKSKKFCNVSKSVVDQDKKMASFSTGRVRFVPECAVDISFLQPREYDIKVNNDTFRPRLMSESSVDSEDSYCIVFETGSDSNLEDVSVISVTSDDDDDDDDDYDLDTEDSDDEDHLWISSKQRCEKPLSSSSSTLPKVKFNLEPTVHTMVHWDYAYRAARKGPWEEMARDRERFRSRINLMKSILDPVLTTQHRTHIWQERFS